jgi:uncharacterized membrane protein
MTVQEQERIERLEAHTRSLAARVESLEHAIAVGGDAAAHPAPAPLVWDPPARPSPAPARPAAVPAPASRPARPVSPPRPVAAPPRPPLAARGLEDLFGGRVLAWLGGVAVLIGIALFFALAVSNGWIGETARVLLAGAGAAALLSLGVWLRERKSQAEAALVAAGTGIAGLFMTVTVAAEVYDLLPALPGFWLAAAVGAVAMVLAVRWRAQPIAALGIVGSLLAPVLVDAPSTGTTVALLFTVTAAAAGILIWQRWAWLGVATFCLATPQWVAWIFETASPAAILLALCAFGGAGVLAAIGFELRLPSARLRASSSMLFALNAIVLATGGYLALQGAGHAALGEAWLAGLAATYVAVGLGASRSKRFSHDLQLLVLALGVLLADVAFAAIVSGPLLALGWAGSSVLFAAVARSRRKFPSDALLAQLGLGGHLALAIGHALVNDASPTAVGGAPDPTALLVIAAIAASCFTSARLDVTKPVARVALDLVGLAAVAYLTALAVDGPALAIAWSVEAVALAHLARVRKDPAALAGVSGFLFLAAIHALSVDVPLGDDAAGLEAVALAAVAAAAFVSARFVAPRWPVAREVLDGAAVLGGAYLGAAALDGAWVAVAWGGAGLALALAAARVRSRALVLAAGTYASLALTHALMFEAPPESFLYGVDGLAAAAAALGVSAAAPLALARLGWLDRDSRVIVAATGSLTLLYLASVAIVTVLGPGGGEPVLDFGPREQGQAVVSALWGLVGVVALVAGLRRDVRELRVAALVLLLATAAKVFVFDLAALTSIYRVVSFVALGLLLLAGSFAYQRLRPTAADPREAVAR